jgi:hypothetical protein
MHKRRQTEQKIADVPVDTIVLENLDKFPTPE